MRLPTKRQIQKIPSEMEADREAEDSPVPSEQGEYGTECPCDYSMEKREHRQGSQAAPEDTHFSRKVSLSCSLHMLVT